MKRFREESISLLILTISHAEEQITLYTAAFEAQAWLVFFQEELDEKADPIGNCSSSLTSSERVYNTTQRECLAISWALLILLPYLDNTRLTIGTDHGWPMWMLSFSDAFRRLVQCRSRSPKLDLGAVHWAGVKHEVADALSRQFTYSKETTN